MTAKCTTKSKRTLNEVCDDLGKAVDLLAADDAASVRAVKQEFRALTRAITRVNRATNDLQTNVGPVKSPPGSVEE